MVNAVIVSVLVVLMLASVFFYWKFQILDKRQMTFLWVSTILMFIVTGAWVVLLKVKNPVGIVILAPLFYYIWYFLTKLTTNLIHQDDHRVIHFL